MELGWGGGAAALNRPNVIPGDTESTETSIVTFRQRVYEHYVPQLF